MERSRTPDLERLSKLAAEDDGANFDHLLAAFRPLEQPAVSGEAARTLAAATGLESGVAFGVLEAASWLYEQSRLWGDAWQERLLDFLTDWQGPDSPTTERLLERLTRLCTPVEARERARQRYWLQHGILSNAVAFSSFVDLRPSFTRAKDGVVELIPVVIVRVQPDEGPASVFQLTEAGVSELRRTVEEIERKLSTLRGHAALSSMLIPRGVSDGE